jgi:hypothetical protein
MVAWDAAVAAATAADATHALLSVISLLRAIVIYILLEGAHA